MLVGLIVAGEIAFWVVLVAGLVARYPLRRPRVGAALLVCVPLVDLVLLVATALDLRRGATADVTHGLAAAYLGFSAAFGRSTVRWADQRFAYWFAGGPPPVRPPRHGWARTRHEWRQWARGLLGWAIACGLLVLAIVWVGDAERTRELANWIARLSLAVVVWLVAFPVWETIFPRRARG
ncbi:hypothetical protein QTQ03_11590 [Micromonospora sp. WMMA1363]|uniref:hypothetical protein n=1 Tax=Micromonospora sp. WMMA1363 TaxID=3053985 RepID=UPI00259CCBBB|nr:hypothetical protein [Micromonospora sp. WMMA1363]MDM4720186.1 hypothetical protein [Micromonospora sp. WMMA1363]